MNSTTAPTTQPAIEHRPLHSLRAHPQNPRGPIVDDESLRDLADSIRAQGILQPLVITPGGLILAGHRRHAAAHLAGLDAAPVVVREGTDADHLAMMIVENVQRSDLTPLQVGRACKVLIDGGLSPAEVSRLVGKHETWVRKLVRMLQLPAEIVSEIDAGVLTASQGTALVRFADKPEVLRRLVADCRRYGLSSQWIDSLDGQGERLRITRFATDEHGQEVRNRQPMIPNHPIAPEDFTGNHSFEDARLAERSTIAEYIRNRAPEEGTKEARSALYMVARLVDAGEHAKP